MKVTSFTHKDNIDIGGIVFDIFWCFANNFAVLKKDPHFSHSIAISSFKNKNYYIPIDNVADLNKANNDWKNNKKVWY